MRLLVKAAVFTLTAILFLLITFYTFRGYLVAPHLKKYLISTIESEYGLKVDIGSLEGNYLTTLRIHRFRTLETEPPGSPFSLAFERADLNYFLLDLLKSEEAFLRDMKIALHRGSFYLDLTGMSDGNGQKKEKEAAFPILPDISLHDWTLRVQDGDKGGQLNQLNSDFQIPKSGKPGRVELRAESVRIDHPRLTEEPFSLATSFTFTREYLKVREIAVNGKSIVQNARISKEEAGESPLDFKADLQVFTGRIRLSGRYAAPELYTSILITGVELAGSADLLAPGEPKLSGLVEGTSRFRLDTDHPMEDMNGTFAFSVRDGQVTNKKFDHITLRAEAESGNLDVQEFRGKAGLTSLTLEVRDIDLPLLAGGEPWQLLAAAEGNYTLTSENVPALFRLAELEVSEKNIPDHRLQLQGDLGHNRLTMNGGLEMESAGILVDHASLALPPENTPLSESPLSASLRGRIPELKAISSLLGYSGVEGKDLALNLDLEGTIAEPGGDLTLSGSDLAYQGHPLGDLTVRAKADSGNARLDSLLLQQNQNRLEATGLMDLESLRLQNVQLTFNLPELADYAFLIPSMDLRGLAHGEIQADGPLSSPKVGLKFNLREFRLNDLPINKAFLEAEYSKGTTTLTEVQAELGECMVTGSGSIDSSSWDRSLAIRMDSLQFIDPAGGDLLLQQPVSLSYHKPGIYKVNRLLMKGTLGELNADGYLSETEDSRLNLEISGFTSGEWLSLLLEDSLVVRGFDSDLTISGKIGSPSITMEGGFRKIGGTLFPFPFSGEYDLSYSSGRINIRRCDLSGSNNEMLISLQGRLPLSPFERKVFQPGDLTFFGLVELPNLSFLEVALPEDLDLAGAASADIRLTGSWQDLRGKLEFQGKNIEYFYPGIPPTPDPFEISGSLALTDQALRVQDLRIQSQVTDFKVSGEWTDGPELIRFLRNRKLELDGTMSAEGHLIMTDLDWLAVDLENLRRLEGRLDMNFTAEGPVRNPEIQGQLTLANGEIRTPLNVPSVKDLAVLIDFEKHKIMLRHVKGELGGAPFKLEGVVQRDAGNGALLDLELTGSNILYFRNKWMKIRADTTLSLEGPTSRPELTGEIEITDAYYQKKLGFLDILRGDDKPGIERGLRLFSFREPPFSDLVFQVTITSENPVAIQNNIVQTSLRPDLELTGTGELPTLEGRIYVDAGKVTLPASTLAINSGLIQFPENAPDNPRLDIMAETRMKGYDIEMFIEGTYMEPVITLSSIPPVPRDELLLLVLTGRSPATGREEDLGQTAGTSLAVYFGRELLGRVLTGENESSIMERLQLEIGRSISQKGEETLEAQFRLGRDIVISKDTLYITAEKDVYDDYNIGLKIVFKFK